MPRILGVDVPREKRTDIAITYIYGVGKTLSGRILAEAQVEPSKRAKDLTEKEISAITTSIQKNAKAEGDLRREVQLNIKRKSQRNRGVGDQRSDNQERETTPQQHADKRNQQHVEQEANR